MNVKRKRKNGIGARIHNKFTTFYFSVEITEKCAIIEETIIGEVYTMSQQEENKLSQQEEMLASEEKMNEEETVIAEEPRERYVPRPKWQLAFAWILVAVMIVAIISYYFWIVYPYG